MVVARGAPTDNETLAEAIVKISAGFDHLSKSGLNRKAIVILLNDWTGVGKRDIERVLAGLGDLSKVYCTKPVTASSVHKAC
jgi:hypothetical protein